ncbi:GTP-binding protein [Fluoribacter dumoffii]|uniref:Rab family GTPase n=1 Tax=Fluoribacter dumoffii TaxID=463 RepID=UPI00224472EE|nr:Rab family GTPase [Fluoribacter dumoffii]MCW8387511.1 GTP-binding protein [Fluoribacter dumoffii]MCW8497714.1 GTP-binding protein [Fluoribacter dumoffii]
MEHKNEYDEHFKIILLGDNAVGKSCLMHTFCDSGFYLFDGYMDTMGVDQKIQKINAFNKCIQLRIWDASGAPKLQKIVASYLRTVDGALICFDLTREDSLHHAREYVAQLRAVKKNVAMILIGCKADLEQRRAISVGQAKAIANEMGIDYLEVSSLKKENTDLPFIRILTKIYILNQLTKIKPTLEEHFNNYLKLTRFKKHAHFFSEQALSAHREDVLREEYRLLFEKLFDCQSVEELAEFFRKIGELIERADELYRQDNPFLNHFISSPLSKVLKHTLDALTHRFAGMKGLPIAKEMLIQKNNSITVV